MVMVVMAVMALGLLGLIASAHAGWSRESAYQDKEQVGKSMTGDELDDNAGSRQLFESNALPQAKRRAIYDSCAAVAAL